MNIIKPKKLKKGDTIGFLTASGPVLDTEKIEKSKHYFEKKGYNVIISDTSYTKKDFLSANDKARVAQIHEFFEDDSINAILCTRGGYGAIRLLEKLDWDLIQKNPKIFGGYSDATAFLNAITSKCSFITYHCPMPYSDFYKDFLPEITEKSFFDLEKETKFETTLNGKTYKKGSAKGQLIGGNLSTLASMIPFDFIPNEKFILFIEDINEPAYKIDRCLTQLLMNKKFKNNLSGIALGDFGNLDEPTFFDNIFYELGSTLNIPILSGLKIGHAEENITIPVGILAELNTENNKLFEI